jgi:hypothetical protein
MIELLRDLLEGPAWLIGRRSDHLMKARVAHLEPEYLSG